MKSLSGFPYITGTGLMVASTGTFKDGRFPAEAEISIAISP